MIVDLPRFLATERPYWQELEQHLTRLETNPDATPTLTEAERFHYLYQRASSALTKVAHLSSERELKRYLEALVARAHAEIQEARDGAVTFRPWRWFTQDFPRAFRRHWQAFAVTLSLTAVGILFGVICMALDPESRHVFLPFGHADRTPAERVAEEQKVQGKNIDGAKTQFSAQLMTHNTQVSLFCMALGMTYAFGTIVLLFYNGAMLGAICFDYIAGGQSVFLMGWLLPHGVIEIPAILLAGQAGLLLGHALIGWGSRTPLADRMKQSLPDIVHIIGGVAVLLVWAGIVEAFLSQYHEPVLPYAVKIAFGIVEFILFVSFLTFSGKATAAEPAA
jgi:uncharacterized membrane protein SpoIIM required for sporulation